MGKWLNDPQAITFEVRGAVAYVTMNRPEKRNAINNRMMTELRAAMLEADDLRAVRCVVLQGAGKDFCAGYDLAGGYNPNAPPDFDPEQYRGRKNFDDDLWHLRMSSEMRVLLFDMFKPVIARVHGNCLAGGTDFALMCDFVIAAHDARIGFPATRAIGSPANHMWLYHVGPQWAKRLLCTGDAIRGREAAKIGLVLKSVAKDRLDDEVAELARRLCAVDADLLSAHKRIVNLGMELMGARTLQRLASENDGRAHLSNGFKAFFDNVDQYGLKEALKLRDAPFGTGDVEELE
ncbi:MAG: crotonase/enoyl-CoA hydratase family protein [Gammaproteobacteria bacterium]